MRFRPPPGHVRAALTALALAILLAGCASDSPVPDRKPDPQAVREHVASLLPPHVPRAQRIGWATDIQQALIALGLPVDNEHVCSVIAVVDQESSFVADPPVANLPKLAREEIDRRAARLGVPGLAVRVALQLESPDGRTYEERLASVRTERDLSDLFDSFIDRVPLGRQLLSGFNPVRTGGPMQVQIDFAQWHMGQRNYPYPLRDSVRQEVFSRRGGLYFGIAHLFDYPADYPATIYRFADFNAGHYASRNAAFQSALAQVSRRRLALDGDLLIPGAALERPGQTEQAARLVAGQAGLDDRAVRRDLALGDSASFGQSPLVRVVYERAERSAGKPLPRAILPEIALTGPKIQRKLTTAWFARRVDGRRVSCLERVAGQPAQ